MDDVKKLSDDEVPKRLGSKPAGAPAPPVITTYEEYEMHQLRNKQLSGCLDCVAGSVLHFCVEIKQGVRSMPFLLMSWLLKSPGHHQFWRWLYQMRRVLVLCKDESAQFYGIMHFEKVKFWLPFALVGNKIVHPSDAVGASPAGAAPTTSSFST